MLEFYWTQSFAKYGCMKGGRPLKLAETLHSRIWSPDAQKLTETPACQSYQMTSAGQSLQPIFLYQLSQELFYVPMRHKKSDRPLLIFNQPDMPQCSVTTAALNCYNMINAAQTNHHMTKHTHILDPFKTRTREAMLRLRIHGRPLVTWWFGQTQAFTWWIWDPLLWVRLFVIHKICSLVRNGKLPEFLNYSMGEFSGGLERCLLKSGSAEND